MRFTNAAVLMTILALFAVCNAMREIKRERSYKLYKVGPKDFRNVVPHLTAEPEHIPKLNPETLESFSKTFPQILTTDVPSLDQSNSNIINLDDPSWSNTNTQTSNYSTQNISNTSNKRKSSPKSASKKSASSSTTSHNFIQSQSVPFHPQNQLSMPFHPNQNQSSMPFHQNQLSMPFHPNQNQLSMPLHPNQNQLSMPLHPNQNQSSMQFHPTAEMGNESSFYQLQAPQVAASQSSNFVSDNPGSPGSPSSNGGDVFRQFSRVFGEESNADDGSLYSIVHRTQSKKG